MSPFLRYTFARLVLFVAVAAAFLLVPVRLDPLIKLMLALVVSAMLSFFLLRGLREQVSSQLGDRLERRTARKDHLRAALAGDDGPTGPGEPPRPADPPPPRMR